jgi:hypothetical protein
MSKKTIFEELKSIRTIIEESPEFYDLSDIRRSCLVDRLQELIWILGEDIGEF